MRTHRLPRFFLVPATVLLVSGTAIADEEPKQDAPIEYVTEKDVFYLPQKETEVTPYRREKCRLDLRT